MIERAPSPSFEVARIAGDGSMLSTLTLEMLLHDLSAPIRHVGVFTDQLVEACPNPTPNQREFLGRIIQNVRVAQSLLEDSRLLLSQERLPLGGAREFVQMKPFLTALAATFQPEIERAGLTLNLDVGDACDIVVDPKALQRLLSNLLSNAVKATPHGGHVTVKTRVVGDHVNFTVEDTGKGYSVAQAERLSQAWHDFDSGVNPPGMWGGLGLLICHSIVLREGGRLSFNSDGPGKGSTFSFALRVWGSKGLPMVGRAPTHTFAAEEVATHVTHDPDGAPDMLGGTEDEPD